MQGEKPNNNRNLAKRLCEKLDVTPAVLPSSHKVEIFDRSAINISGCKKIILYAPCEIRVALSDSVLCVVGRDLVCVAYSPCEVTVEGRIDSVCFKGL